MSGDAHTGSSKDDGEIGLPMTPRLSSTLVILAPSRSSGSTRSWEAPWMRTLMVQRSSRKGSSFRSAVVFPGGVVDDADFETAEIACEAKTYNDEKERKAEVKELAIRIAAVRETFEETGLLLVPSRAEARGSIPRCRAVGAGEAGMSVEEWTAMRDKVHTSAKTFLPFLQKVYERSIGSGFPKESIPVANMAAYSRWITPKTVVRPAKRFDAHFMLTVLDAEDVLSPAGPGPSGVERMASGDVSGLSADQQEVQMLRTDTPAELVEEALAQKLIMFPPQFYILADLASALAQPVEEPLSTIRPLIFSDPKSRDADQSSSAHGGPASSATVSSVITESRKASMSPMGQLTAVEPRAVVESGAPVPSKAGAAEEQGQQYAFPLVLPGDVASSAPQRLAAGLPARAPGRRQGREAPPPPLNRVIVSPRAGNLSVCGVIRRGMPGLHDFTFGWPGLEPAVKDGAETAATARL